MTKSVKVARTTDIPPGGRLLVDLDYDTVALFNIDGRFYCIADVCTHDGGPLAEGDLDGCAIECPRHGARFDVRTGAVLAPPAVVPVPSYPVRVEDHDIYIELPDDF